MIRASSSFLLAVAIPAAAMAKPDFSTKDTRSVIAKYARCVVKRGHGQAKAIVLSNADNGTIIRKHGRLISSDCLDDATGPSNGSVEMRLPGDLVHYALADALVSADFRTAPAPDIATAAPLRHRELDEAAYRPEPGKTIDAHKAEELRDQRARALSTNTMSRFGECVVRADPVNTRALLLADTSTPEEATAFKALGPAFGNCLQAGGNAAISRVIMRGALAINYYRLAYAPRVAAQAASATMSPRPSLPEAE